VTLFCFLLFLVKVEYEEEVGDVGDGGDGGTGGVDDADDEEEVIHCTGDDRVVGKDIILANRFFNRHHLETQLIKCVSKDVLKSLRILIQATSGSHETSPIKWIVKPAQPAPSLQC
jgi:hypothetical protein